MQPKTAIASILSNEIDKKIENINPFIKIIILDSVAHSNMIIQKFPIIAKSP